MPTVIVRHKVGDFATWIKGHQERETAFAPVVSGFQSFQDAGDPNSVVMVLNVTDMEGFGKIVNDPAMNEVKAKHTVIEPITVSMQVATPATA